MTSLVGGKALHAEQLPREPISAFALWSILSDGGSFFSPQPFYITGPAWPETESSLSLPSRLCTVAICLNTIVRGHPESCLLQISCFLKLDSMSSLKFPNVGEILLLSSLLLNCFKSASHYTDTEKISKSENTLAIVNSVKRKYFWK